MSLSPVALSHSSRKMGSLRLAIAITGPSGDEFVVVRHSPPPPLSEEEYLLFSDSDLWDLPSVLLTPKSTLDDNSGDLSRSDVEVRGAETIRETLDLSRFDLGLALDQVIIVFHSITQNTSYAYVYCKLVCIALLYEFTELFKLMATDRVSFFFHTGFEASGIIN